MLSLKKIYRKIIAEQEFQQNAPTTGQLPTNDDTKILDFPKDQFTASLFSKEKKVIFTPKRGTIRPGKMRTIISQLKNEIGTLLTLINLYIALL